MAPISLKKNLVAASRLAPKPAAAPKPTAAKPLALAPAARAPPLGTR